MMFVAIIRVTGSKGVVVLLWWLFWLKPTNWMFTKVLWTVGKTSSLLIPLSSSSLWLADDDDDDAVCLRLRRHVLMPPSDERDRRCRWISSFDGIIWEKISGRICLLNFSKIQPAFKMLVSGVYQNTEQRRRNWDKHGSKIIFYYSTTKQAHN